MKLPSLPYSDSRMKRAMLQFGGVDYTPGAQAGQWEETENVSCLEYPALVPRMGRGVAVNNPDTTALYVYDGIMTVVGTRLYYKGEVVMMPKPAPEPDEDEPDEDEDEGDDEPEYEEVVVAPGPKQIVTVGSYIVVYPDKVYYNLDTGYASVGDVQLSIPWADNVSITHPDDYQLSIPATDTIYVPTGSAGITLSGRGEAVNVNPKINLIQNNTTTAVGYQYVRLNQYVRIDNQDYRVTKISKRTEDYWPGMPRDYITLELDDGLASISNWASCTAAQEALYKADVNKVSIVRNGVTSNVYLNEIEIGDHVNVDNVNGTYDAVDYIDRTLYIDHYYYDAVNTAAIRTAHYQSATYTYPSLLVYGPELNGKKVVLTADGKEIETTVTAYDEDNGLWIKFEDNILPLQGKDLTIRLVPEATPELEYICEHNNRLWGVCGNKIWASNWGDPTQFTETGTSADAWSVEVTDDTVWTGIVSYSGSVLAFTEHMMYKVVGTDSTNYTLYAYHVEGIRLGCHKSAVIIGEVLYYLGPNGVYAYAGSTPQRVSANFDPRIYEDGVAGTDGLRYYLSARRGDIWDLHVLDTEKGIWLREDDTHIVDFAQYERSLYALDSGGTYRQYGCRRDGNDTYIDNMPSYEVVVPIEWYAVTAKLYEDVQTQYVSMPIEHHSYSRFVIRIDLEAGSTFGVEISYDNGAFEPCYMQKASRKQTFLVPVIPRRCEQMRMRLYGKGWFRLRGIVRVMHGGSAL